MVSTLPTSNGATSSAAAPATGKLSRGFIKAIDGDLAGTPDGELKFHFNPTEYSITKANQWTKSANKGRNVPKYEFAGGEPRKLTMELFFDAYTTGDGSPENLRKTLNKLFNLMMISKGGQTRGAESKMSRPPKCQVEWGKSTLDLAFDCYILNCTVKYTMFDLQGVPIRATANLTLQEARDPDERLPTNPTSLGEPGRRLRRVAEGDRLDWIAYQEYGDAGAWRQIAQANGLFNPLDLRPGMVLAVPPR
jgi:hypothetical protein